MKKNTLYFLLPILFLIFSCHQKHQNIDNNDATRLHNQLTDLEFNNGWELLFDGETLKGWRGFKEEGAPKGWTVENGNLIALGKGGDTGGDIISEQQFEDFELYLEWAIEKGGNSGIMFHVLEGDYPTTYATGPEYQLIDDTGFPEKLEEWQKTGANYAMHNSGKKNLKPVGEFNSSRLVVNDGHVSHFLNGEKVVEYDLWTEAWKALVKEGKWAEYPGYGLARKGHISLQDHGSVAKFRNIKIRDLTDKGISIFNGQNLEGWNIHGTEKWYVENGQLVCESGPDKQYGYLSTIAEYKDFILRLQFRQESNGNSGVFIRSAVDGTKISGWQVEVAPMGGHTGGIYESYGRGWLNQIPEENEQVLKVGKWNDMVIMVQDDRIMTWLNNELMSDLRDDKIGNASGVVALQIHDGGGVKVSWRNIYLREI
ncbi:MAG: DUF1080 domain-containing protein [Bacteroidales bacterium]|nr:DUF1080 domain-containing protein [Bacteroidales bacterium]